MSRGPENTFIASVHKHLPEAVYHMKNHNEYIGGVADVWYDGPMNDLWVEYKFIAVPKRDDTVIDLDLSKLQQEWLRNRWNNGRNVAVVVGCKDGGVWFENGAWEKTMTAEHFRLWTVPRKEIAQLITEWVLGG